MILGTVLLWIVAVRAFPESANPITEEPPLVRPDTAQTKVVIFENAACSSWNLILTSEYSPPATKKWSKVILDFSASENGTQYDRYGAFWLGDVELLRTTTAEPTADGIVWTVEKDVTAYLNWFQSPQIAYLSIPNNIDSTYTGIPLVNISLTFYESDENNPPAEGLPTILPLSSSPANWEAIEVTAGSNLTYTTTVPYNDVVGATLELMASPHGCEEFWYTNIDDDEAASKYGLCGGGVYRELQVYVDGILAGAIYPFIVVYTGGINPFLWRPLTGIMSFDIPAYSFDLTPFVLGNGASHEITVKVLGGDSQGGMWYLDAALMLYRDASAAPVSGSLTAHMDTGSAVNTTSGASAEGYGWNTTGTHAYKLVGEITKATGTAAATTATVEVTGSLTSWNTNALTDGAAVETTNGEMLSVHTDALSAVRADSPHRQVEETAFYPYSIVSSYTQDDTTMDMTARVNITYQRHNRYFPAESADSSVPLPSPTIHSVNPAHVYPTAFPQAMPSVYSVNPAVTPASAFPLSTPTIHSVSPVPLPAPTVMKRGAHSDDGSYTVAWRNIIFSDAAYNRTLDHTTVYVETDFAASGYFVGTDAGICYQRYGAAQNGFFVTQGGEGSCDLPGGKYICGYELCEGGDGRATGLPTKALKPVNITVPAIERVVKARNADSSDFLPVRHPLMGRSKLAVKSART